MSGVSCFQVAVVGIGLQVSGANSPQALWKILREGVDSSDDIPPSRWEIEALYDPAPDRSGKIRNRRAALVDGVDMADPLAFRLSKREMRQMDPQHRLLLEAAWHAFEDAGIPLDVLRGSRTGVFVGVNFTDFQRLLTRDWAALDGYAVLGTTTSFAANRISYAFDLRGPSTCVSVGCASSSSALHDACRSLALGEVDLAIAGGVELMLSPDSSIMLSQAGVLSAKGQCRTLDAGADGYVRGEGVGMVVLKPLSKVDASDRVYAVIRGSAVNHNGHNDWIMAASAEAQADVMAQACARGGVDAASLDYVELHGSAFLKGDALEAEAIAQALGDPRRRSPCRLGAISNNIGYLGAAGGVAQLIKVCLSLHHRTLPPTIHVDTPNPQIAFEALGLQVQTRLEPWPDRGRGEPRRAGVISTSLGGSNAFIVLEAAPEQRPSPLSEEEDGPGFVLALSAHTVNALTRRVLELREFLRETAAIEAGGVGGAGPSLKDICYTAAFKRQHLAHRAAFVASGTTGMLAQLGRFAAAPAPASFAEEGSPPALSDCGRLYVAEGRLPPPQMSTGGRRCVSLPVFPFEHQRLWPAWLTPAEVSRAPTARKEDAVAPRDVTTIDLRAVPAHLREERILYFLRQQVAEVLEIEPELVDTREKTFFELGLTSVAVFMVKDRLARAFGISVATTIFFELPRLELLGAWLLAQLDVQPGVRLGGDGRDAAAARDALQDDDALVRAIAGLSDQETQDLLAQKLREISLEVDS